MAESEEELKSVLLRVKEESEKADLKLTIQKSRWWLGSHHFMANRWGKSGNSDRIYFLGSRITADSDCTHEIKWHLLLGRKAMTTSVQFSRSVVSDSLRPHESQHARLPCPSPTSGVHPNGWSSMEFTSIELVMPSSHLILCRPLFLLPPTPPSIRVFSNELTLCMRWPKYWSFSFSIIPSKEHPGLISFRMD